MRPSFGVLPRGSTPAEPYVLEAAMAAIPSTSSDFDSLDVFVFVKNPVPRGSANTVTPMSGLFRGNTLRAWAP